MDPTYENDFYTNEYKPNRVSLSKEMKYDKFASNGFQDPSGINNVNRRSYTKEELDKALADIQSGRIGTRRASVLYGIPRSTLRNKVFRMNSQNNLNKDDEK